MISAFPESIPQSITVYTPGPCSSTTRPRSASTENSPPLFDHVEATTMGTRRLILAKSWLWARATAQNRRASELDAGGAASAGTL